MQRFGPLLCAVLVLTLMGLATGCSSDEDDLDPSAAPRSNVPALRSSAVDSLAADTTEPVPVPDLTLETIDGTSIALAEQDGAVLLINFWATWCPPCRKEIPDLIDLHRELHPKGLTVIGVSFDQDGESVVRPFVEEQGINYPIVSDPEQELEGHFGPIYALPTTIVVGPDGMILRRVVGLFPIDDMESVLRTTLEAHGDADPESDPASDAASDA